MPFIATDPYFNTDTPSNQGIYFIGCCHDIFDTYTIPDGSVLIDPFRKYSSMLNTGIYIPVGIGQNLNS